MQGSRLVLVIVLAAALVFFTAFVTWTLLSGSGEEPVTGGATTGGETTPEAAPGEAGSPAPEVENRDVDEYAAYEPKDPFRELLSPAREETTVAEDTAGEDENGDTGGETTNGQDEEDDNNGDDDTGNGDLGNGDPGDGGDNDDGAGGDRDDDGSGDGRGGRPGSRGDGSGGGGRGNDNDDLIDSGGGGRGEGGRGGGRRGNGGSLSWTAEAPPSTAASRSHPRYSKQFVKLRVPREERTETNSEV